MKTEHVQLNTKNSHGEISFIHNIICMQKANILYTTKFKYYTVFPKLKNILSWINIAPERLCKPIIKHIRGDSWDQTHFWLGRIWHRWHGEEKISLNPLWENCQHCIITPYINAVEYERGVFNVGECDIRCSLTMHKLNMFTTYKWTYFYA